MPYRVFDDDDTPMDAHLDIEGPEFVFHSRGGTKGTSSAHNLDYGPALRLLLRRIAASGRRVEQAWLDSDEVAFRPRADRVVLGGAALRTTPPEQFRIMSAAMKAFGRPPDAKGGSPVKKVRIRVSGVGDGALAEVLGVGYVAGERRSRPRLPAGLLEKVTAEHIWNAVEALRSDPSAHRFGESTKLELIADGGLRLPPKAVFGLAATEALGFPVRPEHFTGGREAKAHRMLQAAGFAVVAKDGAAPAVTMPLSNEDREWAEGRPRLVKHLQRERAAGLSRAKRANFVRLHGRLFCERCRMDPVETFGPEAGPACIEVHHRAAAVRDMSKRHRTRLEDLECLCANCHRIVHALMRQGLQPASKLERSTSALSHRRT